MDSFEYKGPGIYLTRDGRFACVVGKSSLELDILSGYIYERSCHWWADGTGKRIKSEEHPDDLIIFLHHKP